MKIMVGIVIKPILTVILKLTLTISGYQLAFNNFIAGFFLSVPGIIAGIFMLIFAVLFIYYEFILRCIWMGL